MDYSDKVVMPGMVDCHAHLTLPSDRRPFEEQLLDPDEMLALTALRQMTVHLRSGVTTIRDCGARGTTMFTVREAARRGYFPAPRLQLAGRAITHSRGHLHWCGSVADTADEIRRQAIVVLSDGEDTSSLLPFEEVLDLAKRSETAIYAIGLRGTDDSSSGKGFREAEFVLRQFSQETGGRAFFPSDIGDLAGIYGRISDELSSQYTVGYTSKNVKRDGAVFVDGKSYAVPELKALVRRRAEAIPGSLKVEVRADRRALHGDVARVLAALREAGVSRPAIDTREETLGP